MASGPHAHIAQTAIAAAAFVAIGYMLPDFWLGWIAGGRKKLILRALPDAAARIIECHGSAMAKLANWDTTIALFTDEYQVPLLPPDLAADLAASIELTTPILLVLGLSTRPAALVLLGMTAVIEIFVYPQAWPTHIQWAAMLLILLFRGPGELSIDHLLRRWFAIGLN
jgi:putative oxidoreductase